MSYPDIGTVNPAHQLETTSNVTAKSLEIYSDYTFFGSAEYDWARQLRLRVNTPSSSNVFVDMGLEKDGGDYFYISKPLSAAVDPKNNFRIYQNGRILINRTDDTRSERLQVGGDVKVTGNLNVTGTTTVSGDVNITGDLHVTSFDQEQNYIVPEGMIVMWDGAVAAIPPGWALVTVGSGYYLRSNTTQTSVQTYQDASFIINTIGAHAHNVSNASGATNNHGHNVNKTNSSNTSTNHAHNSKTNNNAYNSGSVSHNHNHYQDCGKVKYNDDYINSSTTKGSHDINADSADTSWSHNHSASTSVSSSGIHGHNVSRNISSGNYNHIHNLNNAGSVNNITVNLTPPYREIRLIKKLPYT